MSPTSPQSYSESDRREGGLSLPDLSLPELTAPSQPETEPEVLSVDYFGEIPQDEVAAEAFALYEARGCEDGHDVEDWLAAEALIRQRRVSN